MTLSLDEQRIAEIVQRVVADLRPEAAQPRGQEPARPASRPPKVTADAPPGGQDGVFQGIDEAIAEIKQHRGSVYCGEVVDACLAVIQNTSFEFV